MENQSPSLPVQLLVAAYRRPVVLVLTVAALVAAGLYLNWPAVVALGIAPLIFALAPCTLMCALGLCTMQGKKGPPNSQHD